MELVRELRAEHSNKDRLLDLITNENLSYADFFGNTPLIIAFQYYGTQPNCDSDVFNKILDMHCRPSCANNYGYTALMRAFEFYGMNPNCDSSVLHRLLIMNCVPEKVSKGRETALIHAFQYYGQNQHCDPNVLLKLLDMNCKPESISFWKETALDVAFEYYSRNPNCDPSIFLKLILKTCPNITKSKLLDLIRSNIEDSSIRDKITQCYNYKMRSIITNNRIFRRRVLGKLDSICIF
jgi:hypothetical protein